MRTFTFGLVVILCSLFTSTEALAQENDPRAKPLESFFQCISGTICAPAKVFATAKAKSVWMKTTKAMRGKVLVLGYALKTYVPSDKLAAWRTRIAKVAKALARAGYKAAAIRRLGDGASIVQASAKVAMAMISVDFQRSGEKRTEYLIVVLWKRGKVYKVAFWEDSTTAVEKFMRANRG